MVYGLLNPVMTMRLKLILFPLLLVAAVWAGCSRREGGEFQGYLEGEYVYVASPLGGALTNLAVARGDTVKAGQLLFSLEREAEAAAVREAEHNLGQARAQLADLTKGRRPSEITSLTAQLERARADLVLAEAELVRRQELAVKNVVSKEELDQARAQRDADRAQATQLAADLETGRLGGREDAVVAAQALVESQTDALARARWSYDQKQQFASEGGPVQDTLYRQGEYVAAGNPVVVLLPPDHLKVRFFVPEDWLARVPVGGVVQVTFDGAKAPHPATVSYLSTQAEYTPPVLYNRENRASLVYMVEARFPAADAANLHPGQPVEVKVTAPRTP
jgi:HlyD family secretion protein